MILERTGKPAKNDFSDKNIKLWNEFIIMYKKWEKMK